ncbi:hypothetical protein F2Q70_00025952 [Brassica cretica]|uniref:Uncharacterized protein n=1 Tax=Brassica cretica TaxID=69181 RepID=A0A8S9L066_BRACR|nr:hypothetical protein F2Q70_00025952 [Brassica cretica]
MHGFVSYRRFGRARLLRNDQTVCVLGRYLATELWLELGLLRSDRDAFVLGLYVAAELGSSSIAT